MTHKIYKLKNDEGQIYIGSTNLTLDKRMQLHKALFKRFINNTVDTYCSAFEVLRGTNAVIECLEDTGVIDKMTARVKENTYIQNNDCVNKNLALLTQEQKDEQQAKYRRDNRQKYLDYQRKYKEEHRDYWKSEKATQQRKEYYQKNREKILTRIKSKYVKKN